MIDKYEYPKLILYENEDVIGVINNDVELASVLVKIKKGSLDDYLVYSINTGELYPIRSNGSIKSFSEYNEYDNLMKTIMGF